MRARCDMLSNLPDVLVIEDMRIPLILQRSKRKTLMIQMTDSVQLLVKAPIEMSEREIYRFLKQKTFWIYKRAKQVREKKDTRVLRTEKELIALKEQARMVLTAKTDEYAKQIGVAYTKIRIGNQKTRWGSCSSRGTISYNWRLIMMPEAIMDYVVVHELCHLKEMNHSVRFWKLVASILPDYQECREWLKKNGNQYE